jgi:stress response protein YsnF
VNDDELRDRDHRDREPAGGEVVRSEEEILARATAHEVGRARFRKVVERDTVREVFDRGIEQADVDRQDPEEGDSGEIETLPDGSVSVPVFEEQLVVEKRLVVRERIIIRKEVVTTSEEVSAELKRERVEIEVDDEVDGSVHLPGEG